MQLVFLGTTGYHPNDRRQTACLMLPEVGVVLDAGTGMFRVRDHLQTPCLDIFLTHAHLDHVVGLTYLFDVLHEKQVDRVTVHAEPDKLTAIEQHLLAEPIFPVKLPCEFRSLCGPVEPPQGGRLSYFPLTHPGGSLEFRLDWPGHSLAYVTDTTATADASYLDFLCGVDLLVHECYFPDRQRELAERTGHSYTTPVAQLARAAGVHRLLLVHIDPLAIGDDPLNLTGAQAIFPGLALAEDRMQVDF